jgi:hypothetical protein
MLQCEAMAIAQRSQADACEKRENKRQPEEKNEKSHTWQKQEDKDGQSVHSIASFKTARADRQED